MSRERSSGLSPEQLLTDCAPEVRELAGRLRVLIRDVVPGVTERAYPGQAVPEAEIGDVLDEALRHGAVRGPSETPMDGRQGGTETPHGGRTG